LPSFREFAHEFILHYLAAEGKICRTLRALVRVYGRRVWQTVLKGITIGVAYLGSLLGVTAALGMWAILE
jgi:hypothetical protein